MKYKWFFKGNIRKSNLKVRQYYQDPVSVKNNVNAKKYPQCTSKIGMCLIEPVPY